MFYDRGRTDSFDVHAGFGLGYLYHGSVSGVGICVILLLNRKQKTRTIDPGSCVCRTYALSTLPDFKQDVHTYILFAPPSVLTRTDFTLDFHIFGVFL